MKEKAICSNKLWKAAGKPHSVPIFLQRKSDKSAYKIKIREGKEISRSVIQIVYMMHYQKKSDEFWKCWNAKFGSNNNVVSHQVNGLEIKMQNLQNISLGRVLPISICKMLN